MLVCDQSQKRLSKKTKKKPSIGFLRTRSVTSLVVVRCCCWWWWSSVECVFFFSLSSLLLACLVKIESEAKRKMRINKNKGWIRPSRVAVSSIHALHHYSSLSVKARMAVPVCRRCVIPTPCTNTSLPADKNRTGGYMVNSMCSL